MEDMYELNKGFPLPFVKEGILSAINKESDVEIFYLDGHNNPGFSGGPVVYEDLTTKQRKICGVISGYIPQYGLIGNSENKIYYLENSGLIVAHSSMHINEIIATI